MESIDAWWWVALGCMAAAAVAAPWVARLIGRQRRQRRVITLREIDPNDVYTA